MSTGHIQCAISDSQLIVELLGQKILQIEVEAWNLAQTYFLPF